MAGQNLNISFTGTGSVFNYAQKDLFGRKVRGQDAGPASILTGSFDPIEQKRAMAKKKAYKIVSDAYAGDKKVDDDLKERASKIKYHEKMRAEAQHSIAEIDDQVQALRDEYDIDPDSQEQKDLDILNQYRKNPMLLTPEERERAEELDQQGYGSGYTEYQVRAYQADMARDVQLEKLKDAEKGILEECATIRGVSLERLKYHTVLDAVKESDKILENASDEIKGMLVEEAVDHIDEKAEEEIEKAEEKKEEKKEEEEKIEEAKERREELEELTDPEKADKERRPSGNDSDALYGDVLTEALLKMDGVRNDIKQQVSDVVMKMKLVAEDVKGIKVDELL